MLIVLKEKKNAVLLKHLQELLEKKYGCPSHVIGENRRVLAVTGDTSGVEVEFLQSIEGVRTVDRVDRPYKLASREKKNRTEIKISQDCVIGAPDQVVMMAGPCSIDSEGALDEAAAMAASRGVKILRGGAYKPRTGPYSFQGHGEPALKMLKKAGEKYKMATISEIMNAADLPKFEAYSDILQVGARNMQNYELLKALGKSKLPVLLKRGLAAKLEEWLLAAEYILAGGNHNVMLCERGIRTFEEEVRFTLCLGSVPALRELTHLPIIIDPSHAMGKTRWVKDAALGGVAVGGDGLIIEIHPCPEESSCDASQLLDAEHWNDCMDGITAVASALGKRVV
ncbi:MAG TPA: 3-deoxy-7-phosphoheptulonate synthase [Candidatus Peribacteria bacterium]|nr:3-deoxy-7-phosphoheptulonate synthase [Candidatus Peribacteria bacterium]